jgi:hypothetical protein
MIFTRSKNNRGFLRFTACQRSSGLLKTNQETEESPWSKHCYFRLPARWSIEFFQEPQPPGEFLLGFGGRLGRAIYCGLPSKGHKMQQV